VRFLASAGARHTTGATLDVNGGYVMRERGTRAYSANCAAGNRSAAPRPSFSLISSNFTPTSVRAA